MERLTERFDGWVMRKGCHGPCKTCNGTECSDIYPMIDRLAAYEDTGLEPGDIDALKKREQGLAELLVQVSCGCAVSYTRLEELAQAEKDGRLVVLPCKVGDTAYRVIMRKDGRWHIASATVSGLHMGDAKRSRRYQKGNEYIVLKVDGNFCPAKRPRRR